MSSRLEAAHIVPYFGDHTYATHNGLLPRADLHTLFDLHLLRIEAPGLTIRVSAALAEHEVADRGRRRIERHLAEARLPAGKTLAAIDRLVHHSTILEMNVESYRRHAALDRKRGPGRPAANITSKNSEAAKAD